MSKKKYLLCPGYVESSDGDKHHVSHHMLMVLYKVRASECVIDSDLHRGDFNRQFLDTLIKLRPKANGYYVLPEVETNLNDILF